MSVYTSDTKKRELVDKVAKLGKPEWKCVARILKKYDVRTTQNNNGIFVSLANIDESALKEMCEFVDRCFEIQQENEHRERQIKEFEEEIEQFEQSNKPVFQESGRKDFDLLHAIKSDRNLNALEKSVLKESLNNSLCDPSEESSTRKKSLTPKYTGSKARLLKLCRSNNRNLQTTNVSSVMARSESNVPETGETTQMEEVALFKKKRRTNKPEIEIDDDDLVNDDLEEDDNVEDVDDSGSCASESGEVQDV